MKTYNKALHRTAIPLRSIAAGSQKEDHMGLVNAKITLRNPREKKLKTMEEIALVDTGSVHLCIPEHVKIQFKLDTIDESGT
jgi:hypothetical protein